MINLKKMDDGPLLTNVFHLHEDVDARVTPARARLPNECLAKPTEVRCFSEHHLGGSGSDPLF